jgi:hypothetical protein
LDRFNVETAFDSAEKSVRKRNGITGALFASASDTA